MCAFDPNISVSYESESADLSLLSEVGHLWKLNAVDSTRSKTTFHIRAIDRPLQRTGALRAGFPNKPASRSDGIMRMTLYVCEACLFYHLMLPGWKKKEKKVNRLPSFKRDLCDLALRASYFLRVFAFFCIFLWGMCNGNILNR